jgi:hypothetical protein
LFAALVFNPHGSYDLGIIIRVLFDGLAGDRDSNDVILLTRLLAKTTGISGVSLID